MIRPEPLKIGIQGRCNLVRSALERIVSDLNLPCEMVDDASNLPHDIEIVLISFTSVENLSLALADCCAARGRDLRFVLFPQTPDVTERIPRLPYNIVAIVPPSMATREIRSVISLVSEGLSITPYKPVRETPEIVSADAPCIQPGILTKRQLEILHELAKGESNKAIAKKLGISTNTVEAHVSRIILKLNVRNRTEAALAFNGQLATAESDHKKQKQNITLRTITNTDTSQIQPLRQTLGL